MPAPGDVRLYIVKRTQIYLEDEQDEQLSARATASHRTKSELIREAIDRYLAGGDDETLALARFREALDDVAGIAPYLPPGAEYVEELRQVDRERDELVEQRRRRA